MICSEPGAEIPDDPLRYVPTTAPGVRMPSVIMGNGTPIFDRLGPWFTLAGFGKRPSEALVAAATRRGMPLKVTQFEEPELTSVYGSQLLLVRPDQHIAWRGVACDSPRDADAIITPRAGMGEQLASFLLKRLLNGATGTRIALD